MIILPSHDCESYNGPLNLISKRDLNSLLYAGISSHCYCITAQKWTINVYWVNQVQHFWFFFFARNIYLNLFIYITHFKANYKCWVIFVFLLKPCLLSSNNSLLWVYSIIKYICWLSSSNQQNLICCNVISLLLFSMLITLTFSTVWRRFAGGLLRIKV